MKYLFFCADGTWNDLEMDYTTNVAKIANAIASKDSNGIPQIVLYNMGVGTHNILDKYLGGAFGRGLDDHIMMGYRFLCKNYEEGDKVYLIGFSRGAYVVRSLAGMIGAIGLLKQGDLEYCPEALDVYRDHSDQKEALRSEFKDAYSPCSAIITFLGCWDTVGALGIPDKVDWLPFDKVSNNEYQFHDLNVGEHILHARHAAGLDEGRKEFDITEMKLSNNDTTDLKQIWFRGDHGCIGGGTYEKRALSNIALNWMVDEIQSISPEVSINLQWCDARDSVLETDYRTFFKQDVKAVYTAEKRNLESVNADSLHDSVKQRWKFCFWDRQNPNHPRTNRVLRKLLGDGSDLEHIHSGFLEIAESTKVLKPGERIAFRVDASSKSNDSKVYLEKNRKYRINVSRLQHWKDGNVIPCTANGWTLKKLSKEDIERDVKFVNTKFWKEGAIIAARNLRILKSANWFELIGWIGREKARKLSDIFRVGDGSYLTDRTLTAPESGTLYLSANDVDAFYGNNDGWIIGEIECIS